MFAVRVADNFHYMDDDETYTHSEHATWREAVKVAQGIVDRSIAEHSKPGITADELYGLYVSFGDDPYIVPEPEGSHFSAWDYAKQRCQILAKPQAALAVEPAPPMKPATTVRPNSAPLVTMAGRSVFEDENYILLKQHGFFRIRHPLLTSFYVYSKPRHLAVKATGKEKRFLLVLLGEMVKSGVIATSIKETGVFEDFCAAVLTRGGARWSLFFGSSPQVQAQYYVRA